MIDFFHVLPPLTLPSVLQRDLARIRFLPPALDLRIVRQLPHVVLEIIAGILEVAEQMPLPVIQLRQVDRVVPDPGLGKRLVDGGPRIGVEFFSQAGK